MTNKITGIRCIISKAGMKRLRDEWADPYHGIVGFHRTGSRPAVQRDYMIVRKADMAVILRRAGMLKDMPNGD